jgi:hypothetical protein
VVLVVGICSPELEMEAVLVQVLEVDAVAEVIEGVSKVVVVKGALIANWDYISIIHLSVLQDGNVLEIIVVPRKRNCAEFEKQIELIGLVLIVGMVQVTVLGWADLGDVDFVVYSISEFRLKCLFRFPKNELLEDFCAPRFQPLLEADVELVEVLGGLDVRVA